MKTLKDKIPELNGDFIIHLNRTMLKRLTDDEFIDLWEMDREFYVNEETKKYINARRTRLELVRKMPEM